MGSSGPRGAPRPVNPFIKDTRAAAGSSQRSERLSWPMFCRALRPGVEPSRAPGCYCHITTLGFQCCSLCSGTVKPQLSHFQQPLWDGRAGIRQCRDVSGTERGCTSSVGVGMNSWSAGFPQNAFFLGVFSGLLHHKGDKTNFSSRFGQGSIIGVHLDTWHGTLTFFKNRKCIGESQGWGGRNSSLAAAENTGKAEDQGVK